MRLNLANKIGLICLRFYEEPKKKNNVVKHIAKGFIKCEYFGGIKIGLSVVPCTILWMVAMWIAPTDWLGDMRSEALES